jgi:hypothetical protein
MGSSGLPNRASNVFLENDRVVLTFFEIGFLSSTISVSDTFVISGLERISIFPSAKESRLLLLTLLVRESEVRTVSCEMRIESSLLFHRVLEWLIAVQNGVILFSIVGSI